MMFPFIVLDGPDGVGKTTLAKFLCQKLGATYRHLTYRFPDKMHHYHTAALEMCLRDQQEVPVVLDRWWMSEIAYAAAFRGGSRWPMMGRMLDRVALKHKVLYIICLPEDKERYLEHYSRLKGEREEMYESMSNVWDKYSCWQTLMGDRFDTFFYDMFAEGDDLLKFVNIVDDWRIGPFKVDPKDRRSAGNQDASVLLVGDKSNLKTRRKVWPFFDHGNCSLWFTKTLNQMGLDEYKLFWINLFDEDGRIQWNSSDLVDMLTFYPDVVCLGSKVYQELSSYGSHVHKIYHPQYYRRFHYHHEIPSLREILPEYLFDKGEKRDEAICNLCLA